MRYSTRLVAMVAFCAALVMAASGCEPEAGTRRGGGVALAGVPALSHAELLGDTAVKLRRVFEGPALGWESSPSPDGRFITVAMEAGSLGRLDLITGDVVPIKDKGTWSEAAEWVETTTFSPDGNRVAYMYGTSRGYEIRISDVDGSNERTLIGNTPQFYAVLGPWLEDGILAWYYRDPAVGYEVVGLSPEDGTIREIFAFPPERKGGRLETPLAVSPDGRFFTAGERGPAGSADVIIVRTRDGVETGRISGPSNDIAVAWTPDGRGLLFYSDRHLTEGVWRVAIENGAVTGNAELVRGDLWNFRAIGASRRAFFFSLRTDLPRVRVAEFDLETGMLRSEPTAVSDVAAGPSRLPIWSPDGMAMAYVRPGPETFDGGDQSILVVRSVSGPDAREIPLPRVSVRRGLAWTGEGTIIAVGKGFPGGDWHVYSIDLGSGEVRPVVGEVDLGSPPRGVSPDGTVAYFFRDGALMAVDLVSRRERTVVDVDAALPGHGSGGPVYLSPDGRTAALIRSGPERAYTALVTVSTSEGAMREVFRRETPDGISQSMGVFWAPDSDQLFFSTHGVPTAGEPERLWTADLSGRSPRVTELKGVDDWKGTTELAVSPDGNRVAFVSGKPRGEVWMMTNLSGEAR
jgi:Tol biopolymer transport system component